MRFVALCMICLMFVSSFSGCLASEEDVGSGQYIDDEADLITSKKEFAAILTGMAFLIAH